MPNLFAGQDNRAGASCVVASIDIGTVSTRLMIARVCADGTIGVLHRCTHVTDLGEGVDATHRLSCDAINRTVAVVAEYLDVLCTQYHVDWLITTATSAARDAENASELRIRLEALGVSVQVIEGAVEALLSFVGVSAGFIDTAIAVADIGGGSTELTIGACPSSAELAIRFSYSFDVGCRRVAERLIRTNPDGRIPEQAAHHVRSELCAQFKDQLGGMDVPQQLMCVGGTATSLAALAQGLEHYNASRVHMHELSRCDVAQVAGRMCSMTTVQRQQIAGLQPKRAPVIAAGALILEALLDAGAWQSYRASEADSQYGIVLCVGSLQFDSRPLVHWRPLATRVC